LSRLLTEDERREKFETKWPEWKLIKFSSASGPCQVQHQCGSIKDYETYFNVEKRGPTCQECVDTKKWYWNVGDLVGDLSIINRRARPNTLQEYQYICNVCGFDCSKSVYIRGTYQEEYWATGHSIKEIQKTGGRGCACCGSRLVQPGINDVATTAKDVVDYFCDRVEANKWTRSSEHKVKVVCPICDAMQPNKIQINNLVHEGFDCINCGNNVSYPEKLMYFLLREINVDFKIHKVFGWSKEVYDEYDKQFHKREYDFYIPSVNAIIEMHGGQHYRETFSFGNQIGLEERQRIDSIKQSLAESYCDYYIIVDSRDSNKNYIKNNILSSKLNDLFDLSIVDWNKISRQALNGIAKLVVEDKENNPEKLSTELSEEYGVHLTTIIKWLKKAELYDASQEKKNAGLKRSYPVYSPELNKAFRSMKIASEETGVSAKCINSALLPNNKTKHAGKHPVTEERLTWERWTLEQYEEWCKTNKSTIQN
jgi:hypothetical protein